MGGGQVRRHEVARQREAPVVGDDGYRLGLPVLEVAVVHVLAVRSHLSSRGDRSNESVEHGREGEWRRLWRKEA